MIMLIFVFMVIVIIHEFWTLHVRWRRFMTVALLPAKISLSIRFKTYSRPSFYWKWKRVLETFRCLWPIYKLLWNSSFLLSFPREFSFYRSFFRKLSVFFFFYMFTLTWSSRVLLILWVATNLFSVLLLIVDLLVSIIFTHRHLVGK